MRESVKKVLFLGNSHTYYNDMVYMLKYLYESAGSEYIIDTVMLAHPGISLETHCEEPEVRFNILYGNYDYVVLQQVAHPFSGKEVLLKDAMSIMEFINQANSIPIAYMTWSEKAKPENQKIMTDAYIELAKKIRGILCPVGLAWQRANNSGLNINLYDSDGEHANLNGSYLTACVFYSILMGKSPVGLPNRITFRDKIICGIPIELACELQQIAWETVQSIL